MSAGGGAAGDASGAERIAGSAPALAESALPFPLVARGKVRDVYAVADGLLLMVATDRISAFDVVMAEPIPRKGEVLTQITAWWLARVADLTRHHLVSANPDAIVERVPALAETRGQWARRAMLVRETQPFPIECVVRGYLAGSAWAEYRRSGTLAGEPLPGGLEESARLDPPVFSPATKAERGEHDENIPFSGVCDRIGAAAAEELRSRSLALYARGREIAEAAGIIVADTKFEFGAAPNGEILLIDEVLTPDSSRFWPRERYAAGRGQPSLDKQPLRDHLEALAARGEWDRAAPPPPLPADVVAATSARYQEVFRRLTGYALDAFPIDDPAAPGPA